MSGSDPALDTIRRIRRSPPPPPPGERCEMCAEQIPEEHQHVVDLEQRGLMCTCRGCYLLFSEAGAKQRYRAVPDRHLELHGFRFTDREWDDLQIPVGLAFLFHNSSQERVVAFYPSPAGATESELPLEAWQTVVTANPALTGMQSDVEALLLHRDDDGRFVAHVVPIDLCYELVGTMRATWRGFDGGHEARAAMATFFSRVAELSRPVDSKAAP